MPSQDAYADRQAAGLRRGLPLCAQVSQRSIAMDVDSGRPGGSGPSGEGDTSPQAGAALSRCSSRCGSAGGSLHSRNRHRMSMEGGGAAEGVDGGAPASGWASLGTSRSSSRTSLAIDSEGARRPPEVPYPPPMQSCRPVPAVLPPVPQVNQLW